jgi:DNA-binding NtrC family response regulator
LGAAPPRLRPADCACNAAQALRELPVLDGEGQPEHAARAGAEGIARDNRDAFLDQKLAGEIERALMAVAELDEAIERAARVTCNDAVGAEFVHEDIASALEQASPCLHGVLRAGERGLGRDL